MSLTIASGQTVQPDRLTKREQEVLLLIAEGLTTKEISTRLGVSFKTAACHRSRILSKFNVHNSVMLVRTVIKEGIIQP